MQTVGQVYSEADEPVGYMPISQVASRYNRSYDTIYRWVKLGRFPKPIQLNGRNYWDPTAILEMERSAAHRVAA